MIELAEAQKSRSRVLAFGITLLCLLAGYMVMALWTVEAPVQKLEVYEKLEWFKFTPLPTSKMVKTVKKEASKKSKRPDANPVKKTTTPRKVELDIAKLKEVLKIDLNTAISASAPKSKAPNAPATGIEKIKIEELLPDLSQTQVLKGEVPSLPIQGIKPGKPGRGRSPGLAIEDVEIQTVKKNLKSL